jgi:crotonobetainyl-CoA:carnitine CoA-transferase CaiB-like acyl-CoA transferase
MPSALDSIRVIDFGQYIAGPLCGMLLADQGADVIRVDPPGGPVWQTPANATWNRGKRSISLDLKQPGDIDTARRLMASADVVIENFRPGVMARLGLG